MAGFVYIAILATSLYTLIACVQAISQLVLWIRSGRYSKIAPKKSNTSQLPLKEKGFQAIINSNPEPEIFKASGDRDPEKNAFNDISNRQGLANNSMGNRDLLSLTKKAETGESLEYAQTNK